MRSLYSLVLYLAAPMVMLWLLVRGLRDARYLRDWRQRLGLVFADCPPGMVCIHAASVGEVNAAAPLIRALQRTCPQQHLLLTTFTVTGAARGRELFGQQLAHQYLPLDYPGAVRRFMRHHRPRLLVVMETELWPNLLATAARHQVPLVLANARLSERSTERYQKFRALIGPALQRFNAILAQGEVDAGRFAACGAPPAALRIAGNLKFELSLPGGLAEQAEQLREQWGADRFVLVAGSTHEADEKVLLDAFGQFRNQVDNALLVLVPRHPERFRAATETAKKSGLQVCLHSGPQPCSLTDQCLVVDAMGVLMQYYASADVAFVGGSIGSVGGHNVLEPAALGKAVLFGPNTKNLAEIADELVSCGGALRVAGSDELLAALLRLADNEMLRHRMGGAGLAMVDSGRGAVAHALAVIEPLLGKKNGRP